MASWTATSVALPSTVEPSMAQTTTRAFRTTRLGPAARLVSTTRASRSRLISAIGPTPHFAAAFLVPGRLPREMEAAPERQPACAALASTRDSETVLSAEVRAWPDDRHRAQPRRRRAAMNPDVFITIVFAGLAAAVALVALVFCRATNAARPRAG